MEDELHIDPTVVADELTDLIRRSVKDFKRDGAIVGLSGGIDSAVVATLAVRALGPEHVQGLIMPERDSAPESRRLAQMLARKLGIQARVFRLTLLLAMVGAYFQLPMWLIPSYKLRAKAIHHHHTRYSCALDKEETPFSIVMIGTQGLHIPWLNQAVAYHRVKVRLRMVLLYYYAELNNLLVLGTCNKTELMIGFFVKYGDSLADITPIAHLYKTQVRVLANYLGVPNEIISRPPSPDILPGLTDELAIGLDYATIDRMLCRFERGLSVEDTARELGLSIEQARYIETLTNRARYLKIPYTTDNYPFQ